MSAGLPNAINILGTTYSVEYLRRPSDVDIHKREALWGQVDFWTRTIRVYHGPEGGADREPEDLLQTLMHECLHVILAHLHLTMEHDDMDLVSVALADMLSRNEWVTWL